MGPVTPAAAATARAGRGERSPRGLPLAPLRPPPPTPSLPRAGPGALASSLKWRDVFNITVRWRQISEPCDPVAWVDLLT